MSSLALASSRRSRATSASSSPAGRLTAPFVALPGAGAPAPGSATNGAVRRPAGELEAEVARLRRELANAKLDNEILRKAAAYFARESR